MGNGEWGENFASDAPEAAFASDASKTPETAKDGVTPQTHNPPTHSPVTCAKLANRTTVRSRSRKEPNFATCNSEA